MIENNLQPYHGKLAVLYQTGDIAPYQALADNLAVPLRLFSETDFSELFYLTWRESCLKLLDQELLKKGGLMVEIDPRAGEQRSWPAPKDGALAQAIGRKTKTVLDATTGWGQDSLHIFRMGYQLTCMERSPVMAELLADGFTRLAQLDWMQNLNLLAPPLLVGNAIELLQDLAEPPECIYLDPMFPPKRKKSALAKKSMVLLRDLLGDDEDKGQLFAAAIQTAGKRVVVKSPDYADPLGGKPSASYAGKLMRYDVYLKVG